MAAKPAYVPPAGIKTSLEDFMIYVQKTHSIELESYYDLRAFSINRMNDFWMSFWDFAGIKASQRPTRTVDESLRIDQFPKFFEDAKLNFAENILCGKDDDLAIISMDEKTVDKPERYTWRDMRYMTAKYAAALEAIAIGQGDYMVSTGSNCARSLGILLAAASVGAVIANFATDIGEKALSDRLDQLRPKLIIAETEYSYNGKSHTIEDKISRCYAQTQNRQACRLVLVGPSSKISCQHDTFDNFQAPGNDGQLRFSQLPFNTPLLVMFSSSTTGAPTGIVHSHGGLVLNGHKEFLLNNGFGPQNLHIHFSNIGWTLWNISLGALFTATPMILYDGSPFKFQPNTRDPPS
ncbi:Putative AMP-dependent synthetase/ligase, ANL domain-containing protein [Septoria linicola]|uniref:AMP-dependent synthetase/ligase, ANL domain-containing protein n=1 Tax=Septoria linicola TaxID=215465 RepID=A0A9Q9AZI6_9PEZI|nr:Putative AMP-dependent synthetase/ligase, ANL domain-containing protein [Septoria linicola]